MSPSPLPPPRRILVLRQCCLGDLLMATPLLRCLAESFPRARIDVAAGPWARPVLEGHPRVSELLPYPKLWGRREGSLGENLRRLRELRERAYDVIVCLEVGFQPSLMAWAIGAPVRAGYRFRGKPQLHTHVVDREVNDLYEAEAHLRLAERIGATPRGLDLEFPCDSATRERARSRLEELGLPEGRFVLLVPGGGSNPGTEMTEKRWPLEEFAALARELGEDHGLVLAVLGGPDEVALCEELQEEVGPTLRSLLPSPDLATSAAWMQMAGCVVTNDSMAMHLAAGVGARQVALFGPTDPLTVAPRGERVRVVRGAVAPCYQQILGTFDRERARAAITSLSREEVRGAVLDLLGQAARS